MKHAKLPETGPLRGGATSIPIARPCLSGEEADAVTRVLRSGWVSQGPEVAAFEQEFADTIGAPLACAVSSCTAALHVALVALDVGAGDEVVTVSHSFIATANAVRLAGAMPVFVDVDPVNGNIDPALVEAAITPRTRALLVVHQLGMPAELPALLAVAERHGLPVLEDAACAVGSEIEIGGAWQRIGRPHAAAACFSFHPRKVLTTGDGGMLTTNNPDLDRRFRLLRQHGMSVSDRARHQSATVVAETYECFAFNYRMTDVQAAIGRMQLKLLPTLVEERRELAANYTKLLRDIAGLGLPQEPAWAKSNWQSYCVRLPSGIEQLAFMQAMLDRGISTRRGVMCSHREPAYRLSEGRPLFRAGDLRYSEYMQDHGVLIPLFNGLSAGEQAVVAETIGACLESLSN